MRRLNFTVMGLVIILAGVWGIALAQKAGEGDSFNASVDLARFRRGNGEWDTQELVASGLTALHQENVQILKELQDIKSRLARLEGK